MDRRHFLAGAAAATLGAAGLISREAPPAGSPAKRSFAGPTRDERRRSRFVNALLTTHEGEQVRFYDDLIRDRIVLLNFFYIYCVDMICPTATANLVELQKLLGTRVGRDLFMYSITLEPERDTPNMLERYVKGFGVKPGWLFLTGQKQDIEAVRHNLGEVDLDPVVDARNSEHTGMLHIGFEPLERWSGCPSLTDPRWISRYIAWMEPGGARPDHPIRRKPAASSI